MKILSLDIGTRRTGVAFYDDATGVPLPLSTLRHASTEELVRQVREVATSRSIDRIIVGLPYLPSGEEGAQAAYVRKVAEKLVASGLELSFMDERYSTPRGGKTSQKHEPHASRYDGDAAAALVLLQIHMDRDG